MKKALIVEFRPCHQELLPTWVWLLTRIGYEVHVFVTQATPSHRNILSTMQHRMKLRFVVASTPQHTDSFDLVLNNSLYPDEMVCNCNISCSKVLSVLHTLAKEYRDSEGLQQAQHTLLALGPHLSNALDALGFRNIFAPPIYFGSLSANFGHQHRIVVQGTMEIFRRNYGCLAQMINTFGARFEDLVVEILGDGNSAAAILNWLLQKIRPQALCPRLQYKARPNYDQYLEAMQCAGWVMPCIDETFEHTYFSHKITSSVMLAVGNGVPLLLHRRLADLYGLRDGLNCICYESFADLEQTFERAMTLPPEAYASIVTGVRGFRNDWLQIAEFNFRQILGE